MAAGDWHQNTNWAEKMIRHAQKNGCDAILHVGDFGYWPRDGAGPRYYRKVVEALRFRNMKLYWVDGNHEDHFVLHASEGIGNEVIRHLPRGHRWQWWGKTWMGIGGAVSVDKKWRVPGIDWFPEETITPRQFEHCLRPGDVDIVIAHDAPEGVDIPGIHALEKLDASQCFFPIDSIHESWAHRGILADIVKDKQPRYWFHGHYHVRYNGAWFAPDDPDREAKLAEVPVNPATPPDGGMLVVGLDCDITQKDLNAVFITAKDLP